MNINTPAYWDEIYQKGDNEAVADTFKFEFFARQVIDGMKIVDLGCGAGNFLKKVLELKPKCTCHGVDFSKNALTQLAPNILGLYGNVTNTQLLDETYDLSVSFETAEHLLNPYDLICELARLTKDLTFFTTPLTDHIPSAEHVKEFTLSEIESQFKFNYKQVFVFPFASGRCVNNADGTVLYKKGTFDTIAVIASKKGSL